MGTLQSSDDTDPAGQGQMPLASLADQRTFYLNAAQVRARYGGVSEMTLWRWLQNRELGFPKPYRINRLRYWDDAKLSEWERTRCLPEEEAV